MCGVFALFLNRPLADSDIARARDGRDRLTHRGPDGAGEWIDREAGVYLGHRRLSIIDLSDASAQPMSRGGVVATYNGEIYNYLDLRRRLEGKGAVFSSNGDAEVLLQAWLHWGEGALNQFDGMFAFALWDGKRASLATDPFGEKSLYWAEIEDGIAVSSELDALRSVTELVPSLEGEALAAYLAMGYVPPPATAYRRVYTLPAASVMTIVDGRAGDASRYWTPPFPALEGGTPAPLSESELDGLRDTLVAGLERRLIADVPLCLFLSSGVDSALAAALMRCELGREVECLTVSFPSGGVVDEAGDAAAIASHLGLSHRVVESTADPREVSADALLGLMGQPSDNLTALSIQRMSQAARSAFTAGLVGTGGDELFYGYAKHAFIYKWRRAFAAPESLRKRAGTLARAAGRLDARFGTLGSVIGVADHERYLAAKAYDVLGWLRKVPGFDAWARSEFAESGLPLELDVPRYELLSVMAGTHMRAFDLGSMRASLELRSPFLSRAVHGWVAGIDPRRFMAFGQKEPLRRLLARYLPGSLIDRPKRGFIFPQADFVGPLQADALAVPGLDDGLCRAAWVRRLDGPGTARLATRLAVAARFLRRGADMPGEGAAMERRVSMAAS